MKNHNAIFCFVSFLPSSRGFVLSAVFPRSFLHLPIVSSLSFRVSFCSIGLSFELFHAYRYVRHVQFYEGKHIRRADGRRLIKAWVCALGVLVSTALGAGDDVAVWTPMASSRRPTTNVGRGRRRRRRQPTMTTSSPLSWGTFWHKVVVL